MFGYRLPSLCLAASLLAAPLAAEQETPPAPEPGTRVRLTSCYSAIATAGMVAAGTLSSWRSDSVLVRPERTGTTVGVPRAWITHIEVSRGKRTSTGKGAVIGF